VGVRNLHPEGRFPTANVTDRCHGPAMVPADPTPGNAFAGITRIRGDALGGPVRPHC